MPNHLHDLDVVSPPMGVDYAVIVLGIDSDQSRPPALSCSRATSRSSRNARFSRPPSEGGGGILGVRSR